MCGSYHRGMSEGLAQQRGTTVSSSSLWDASKPFQSSNPLQNFMYKGGFARGKDLNKQIPSSKESTPPAQRSAPSSSGGPTSLGIRRGSGSVRKRSVSSGRSRSKSKRFSTTR